MLFLLLLLLFIQPVLLQEQANKYAHNLNFKTCVIVITERLEHEVVN